MHLFFTPYHLLLFHGLLVLIWFIKRLF